MLESLLAQTALPNLHPAIVHFPVALLVSAVVLDLACLFLRRQVWLDRAASLLYTLGTLSAGAAYLTGRQAAETMRGLPGAAEAAMADHEDLAFLTLLVFVGITLLRLLVTWLARGDTRIRLGFFRLLAFAAAVAGQALLVTTADHGGALVYRHGLGVKAPQQTEAPPKQPG